MTQQRRPVKLSKRAWLILGTMLIATVAAEPFVHHHASFGIDGTFGFHAWYGFATCCAMVFAAKLFLGKVLSRPDDYYDA